MSIKWLILVSLQCVVLPLARGGAVISSVEVMTSERLGELMTGQWMVEFYAPWCPACKQFADTWERFAEWAAKDQSSGVRVANVDVTAETMLSGQFMVTHLPSIYHIQDGAVRVYTSSRSYGDLVEYLEDGKWREVEPVPWWRSPTASHMRVIGVIFWLSEKAKELQTTLEKDYDMPTYAVFIVIAVATIVVGLTLGGLTVCCIEVCMRMCSRGKTRPEPRPRPPVEPTAKKGKEPAETTPPTQEATPTKQEAPPTKQASPGARQRKNKSKKKSAKDED